MFVKKKCTEIMDDLKQKNARFNMYFNSSNKREEKKEELKKKVIWGLFIAIFSFGLVTLSDSFFRFHVSFLLFHAFFPL